MATGVVSGVTVAAFLPAVPPWLPGGVAVGVAALATGLTGRRWARAVWALACVAMGIFWVQCQPWGPVLEGPVAVRGTVIRTHGGFGALVRVQACSDFQTGWRPCVGALEVRGEAPLEPGMAFAAWGQAGPIGDQSVLPGAPDPVRAARRSRVRSVLRVRQLVPVDPPRRAPCTVSDRTGVLCAVASGQRSGLDPEAVARLRRTGTAHLLAISGFHVGAVGGAIGAVVAGLSRATALWWRRGIPLHHAWLAAAAGAWVYVWSAGAPVSAQRAAWMWTWVALGRCAGGQVTGERVLALAALMAVVADPGVVGSPSFQLSFGAVLGIVRFAPRFARWLPPDPPVGARHLAQSVAVTLGASLGTLPAVAWWFQSLSPASPVANAVAIPWSALTVVPAALCAVHGPDSVQAVCADGGTAAVDAMLAGLAWLDWGVWTPAVGPVGALALTLPLWIPRRPRWWVPVCLWALLGGRPPPSDTVTVLDVGQGDATWVDWRGRTWLVDGGPPSESLVKWLRRSGIRHIDTVVATHGNVDHTGGLEPVLRELSVGALWVTGEGGPLVELARSRGIPVQVRPSEALHPPGDWPPGDDNDDSLVLRLAGVLLTGDIEQAAEDALASRSDLHTPVLRLAHHGSQTSTTQAFLEAVRPSVAVVSAGRGNRFGHPHASVLDSLRLTGVSVFRTDRHGTLQIDATGPDVRVRTHRAGGGWSPWTVISGEFRDPLQPRYNRPSRAIVDDETSKG